MGEEGPFSVVEPGFLKAVCFKKMERRSLVLLGHGFPAASKQLTCSLLSLPRMTSCCVPSTSEEPVPHTQMDCRSSESLGFDFQWKK